MSLAQLEKVIDLLTSRERPENPTVEDSRAGFEKLARTVGGKTPADVRQVDAGGVPSELVSAEGASDDTATLYLHGGGYCNRLSQDSPRISAPTLSGQPRAGSGD